MTDAAIVARVKRMVCAVNGYPMPDEPTAASSPPAEKSPARAPVEHHHSETPEPSADAARRRIDAYVAAKFGP